MVVIGFSPAPPARHWIAKKTCLSNFLTHSWECKSSMFTLFQEELHMWWAKLHCSRRDECDVQKCAERMWILVIAPFGAEDWKGRVSRTVSVMKLALCSQQRVGCASVYYQAGRGCGLQKWCVLLIWGVKKSMIGTQGGPVTFDRKQIISLF